MKAGQSMGFFNAQVLIPSSATRVHAEAESWMGPDAIRSTKRSSAPLIRLSLM
jgi:hypothetical protein